MKGEKDKRDYSFMSAPQTLYCKGKFNILKFLDLLEMKYIKKFLH